MPAQVSCSIVRGVATVTLDNPGRRNAVSAPLFRDLEIVLGQLEANRDVRVVVLTGAGSSFCVGADLAAPPELRILRGDSIEADTARLRAAGHVAERLHLMPQLTVAAINGACAGAGLSLALAADIRIASEAAVFNTAFLSAGLPGDLGGIWFLTRLLGAARARELFLLPEKFDAHRAAELSLVTEVSAAAGFGELIDRVTARLASAAPLAARDMKKNLLAAQIMPLGDFLGAEVDRMVRCFHTGDAREASAAFLERRDPVFTGR